MIDMGKPCEQLIIDHPEQVVKTIIWFQDKARDLRKPERPPGREALRESCNAVLEPNEPF